MTKDPAPWALLIPVRTLARDPLAVPFYDAVADAALYVIKPSDQARKDLSSVPMVLAPDEEQPVADALAPAVAPLLTRDRLARIAEIRDGEYRFDVGFHAAPMGDVWRALARSGFRIFVAWDAAVADALGGAALAGGGETDEAFGKAIADIKEWFEDRHARAIVENLAGPATADEIADAERALGLPLPADLRALY